MRIETEKFLTIRNGAGNSRVVCDLCEGKIPMLTSAEATQFVGTSLRQIFRLVENGQLHFRETPDGLLLICFDSLSKEKEKIQ